MDADADKLYMWRIFLLEWRIRIFNTLTKYFMYIHRITRYLSVDSTRAIGSKKRVLSLKFQPLGDEIIAESNESRAGAPSDLDGSVGPT